MSDKKWITKEVEKKEEWGGGAKRNSREGKGRYDLVSPMAIKRIADVYERGATIYGDRNYEKGIPLSRYVDSALRHLYQYLEGKQDEDHAAQCAWNLLSILHTEEMIARGILPKELNDLPSYPNPNDDPLNWRKREG